MSKKRIIEGKV